MPQLKQLRGAGNSSGATQVVQNSGATQVVQNSRATQVVQNSGATQVVQNLEMSCLEKRGQTLESEVKLVKV